MLTKAESNKCLRNYRAAKRQALAAATCAAVLANVPPKWETPLVEIGAVTAQAQGSNDLRITQFVVETFDCFYQATLNLIDPLGQTDPDSTVGGNACSQGYLLKFAEASRPRRLGVGALNGTLSYMINAGCCAVGATIPAQINAGNALSNIASTEAVTQICLSGDTMIDTPLGAVRAADLKVGAPVWTLDAAESRIPSVVLDTQRIPVPPGSTTTHLVPSDGREAFVSGSHPLTDGRLVEDLRVDDLVDGARTVQVMSDPYTELAKYDLLAAGDTGVYWANGIPMKSTIERTEREKIPSFA